MLYVNGTSTYTLLNANASILSNNAQLSTTGSNITNCNQKNGLGLMLLDPFLVFLPSSWASSVQNSLFGCSTTTNGNGVTDAGSLVGVAVYGLSNGAINVGPSNSVGGLVAQTIAIVAIVGAVAIAASILGNGLAALYLGAAGVGIALIYFMQSILASSVFNGTPFFIQIFIDGITGAMFIWIVLVMLRG